MIYFSNNLFILSNNHFKYVIGIDDDNKLFHAGFFPRGTCEDMDYTSQRNRLDQPYPFEVLVNVNYEPLQCSHGVRYFWSLSSYRATFESYSVEEIKNGEKLTITLIDKKINMYIHLIYELYSDSPSIRKYTSVENMSEKTIIINHISSFVLANFPYFSNADDENDLYLHQFKSHWSWEGNHDITSFDQLGLYKKWCRNGFAIENTSTWVCQKNIPYFVIEEREQNLFWGVQIETSGSWRFEVGCAEIGHDNWFYMQGGMGNDLNAQWYKTLLPGEFFTCPACSLTTSKGSINNIYNNMHKHQQIALVKHSTLDENLPVIYNDWQYMFGQVNDTKIIEQLDILEESGVECYVIDAGWFTDLDSNNPRSSWWDMAGDWEFDKARFPEGLGHVVNEIASHGMIPGIWCEIEAVGKLSELFNNEALLMKRGEFFVEDINRRFLYFGYQEVRDYADKVFEKLIGYGFRYFKIDYNIDSAPGCTNSNDSLGQGLYMHRLGYYQWLDELKSRHPDIIIENCSSGGMRLEYGMLSHTDLASITDQESNHYTGNILFQISKLIHPSQCGNWSALKDSFNFSEFAFTLTNSMMGRMNISGNILNSSVEKQLLLKRAILFYKRYRNILKSPTIIYHTSDVRFENNDKILAFEYRNDENTMSIISVMRLNTLDNSYNVKPTNLKYGIYEVSTFPENNMFEMTSDILNKTGLNIELECPYSSQMILLHLIK